MEGFDQALSLKETAAKLPRRSKRAVTARKYVILEKNGRTPKRFRGPWTEAEDAILLEEYAKGISLKDIATKLPGRDADSCDRRVKRFRQKIRKGELNGDDFDVRRRAIGVPWTEAEVALLLEEYAKGIRFKGIATKLPGRTEQACQARINISRKRFKEGLFEGDGSFIKFRRIEWTEEEDALLIHELKGGARYKNISEKLPGRTPTACAQRRLELLKE